MRIGAMNHPARPPLEELRWMGELGFDFVDLTLEPPAAGPWQVDVAALRAALTEHRLGIVGHTAYYLPLASPFPALRRAAVDELRSALDVFAALGARWMNVHPDRWAPFDERAAVIARNLESLGELVRHGREVGVGVMIENLPGDFNTPEQLDELLEPMSELGLHLDIGHANLLVTENTTPALVGRFAPRIAHVHLHDNNGGSADLHLPLGAGRVDVDRQVRTLRASGWDGTITLEVFSPDRRHLAYSRDVLRRLWDAS